MTSDLARRVLRRKEIASLVSAFQHTTKRSDMCRLGSEWGGWWVPTDLIHPNWICYSGGAGGDITFDLALIERFGCSVWAFDPVPKVIEWAGRLETPAEFNLLPYGLWNEDTTVRFYAPVVESDASFSIDNIQGTTDYFEGECRTVASAMSLLGHTDVDLLKLDIEGAEGAVIDSVLASNLRPMVIAVEFDLPEYPWRTRARVTRLRDADYDLAYIEGRNYTFVRRSL